MIVQTLTDEQLLHIVGEYIDALAYEDDGRRHPRYSSQELLDAVRVQFLLRGNWL